MIISTIVRIVRTQMLYDRITGFSDWFENAKDRI